MNTRCFIESCPHYFTLTKEELFREDGYLYTLAPPLRSQEEMMKLRAQFSHVYAIGTDHCAFFKEDKNQYRLNQIPLGIGGIEYSFDLMYQLFGEAVIPKMSTILYRLHKIHDRGLIQTGKLANLFVYDLMENTIDDFHGFTDYTVYKGMKRKGRVIHTLHRGAFLVRNMNFQYQKGRKI